MAKIVTNDYLFRASCGNARLLEHHKFPGVYILVTQEGDKEIAEVIDLERAIRLLALEGTEIDLGQGNSIKNVGPGWAVITGLLYSEHMFRHPWDAYKFYHNQADVVITMFDKSYVCDRAKLPEHFALSTAGRGAKVTIDFLKEPEEC